MRNKLDALYRCSEWIAAFFVVAITVLILSQVFANIASRFSELFFGTSLDLAFSSYAEFSGYMLATASFLALAGTLRSGVHVRVTLLLHSVSSRVSLIMQGFAAAVGAATTLYFAWRVANLVYESWLYNDVTFGLLVIPMWIPQFPMIIGLVILSIAFVDLFFSILAGQPFAEVGEDQSAL